jgi:hypothetical protein
VITTEETPPEESPEPQSDPVPAADELVAKYQQLLERIAVLAKDLEITRSFNTQLLDRVSRAEKKLKELGASPPQRLEKKKFQPKRAKPKQAAKKAKEAKKARR